MNNPTRRRVMLVAMVSALPFAATVPSACSGGGVAADPAAVTAFQDLQIDNIKILPEAIVTKRLDEFEAGESAEEFEVFLFDDAVDHELYCSGRTEGMVAVQAVNVAYANLGATFIPMNYQKIVVNADPNVTIDRIRVEVWEMDHGVCPGETEDVADLEDANDLVAVQVFPAKALLAAQELTIDNKVTMTISLNGTPLVADPSLAIPEATAFRLDSVVYGPLVTGRAVAVFDAVTSQMVACVNQSDLQDAFNAGKSSGLNLLVHVATGVFVLPPAVRVGIAATNTLCPNPITPGLGDNTLYAISHRLPVTQLVGQDIMMNDGVSKVRFLDSEAAAAAAVAAAESVEESDVTGPEPTDESDEAVFDFQPYAKLRVTKLRYGAVSVSESGCLLCTSKTPEIEVFLFTADHKPVACAGEDQGLASVDDPAVLYESLDVPLIQAWTAGTLTGDTFYWGLVERDKGTCPNAIFTGGGANTYDQIFAKSDVHTLPELVNADVLFPDIVNATITVIQQP